MWPSPLTPPLPLFRGDSRLRAAAHQLQQLLRPQQRARRRRLQLPPQRPRQQQAIQRAALQHQTRRSCSRPVAQHNPRQRSLPSTPATRAAEPLLRPRCACLPTHQVAPRASGVIAGRRDELVRAEGVPDHGTDLITRLTESPGSFVSSLTTRYVTRRVNKRVAGFAQKLKGYHAPNTDKPAQ